VRSGRGRRRDPAHPESAVGVAQHTQGGEHLRAVGGPVQLGTRLQVASVEVRVGTRLLDDEDLDTQAQDRIERQRIDRADIGMVEGEGHYDTLAASGTGG
jgi:hypothetical protein